MNSKVWTVIAIALAAWMILGGIFLADGDANFSDGAENSDARH